MLISYTRLSPKVRELQNNINKAWNFEMFETGLQHTVSAFNTETITDIYLSNNLADSISWRSFLVKEVKKRMILLGKIAKNTNKEQQTSSYFRFNNTYSMLLQSYTCLF